MKNIQPAPVSIDALMNIDPESGHCAAFLSGGLVYGLRISQLLLARLKPAEGVGIRISAHGGHADGLFFHDEVRGLAARVTVHQSAGCVRLYLGKSDDFEFPTRVPKDGRLEPTDFAEDEIPEHIDEMVKHFESGIASADVTKKLGK